MIVFTVSEKVQLGHVIINFQTVSQPKLRVDWDPKLPFGILNRIRRPSNFDSDEFDDEWSFDEFDGQSFDDKNSKLPPT